MIATIMLALFILSVPINLRKQGIRLIVSGHAQGEFLLMFSKMLWWFALMQIAYIWAPIKYQIFVWGLAAALILYKTVKDRKYLAYRFKKNPSL